MRQKCAYPNRVHRTAMVAAILMEISEDWQSAGKRYVVFNNENVIDE